MITKDIFSFIYKFIIITSPIGFSIGFVDSTLVQRCVDVAQLCFDVLSTTGTSVVSMLSNVENGTSDFASVSALDKRIWAMIHKVERTVIQRWNVHWRLNPSPNSGLY